MPLTAGTATLVQNGSQQVKVIVTAATSGTAPYIYQWYMSTTTGFSPGPSNILSGQTSLAATVTGLIPNVTYFFKNRVTDSASPAATSDSAQLSVTTQNLPQNQNQFAQTALLGMVDMAYNFDTHPVEIDVTQSGTIYAGSPVKLVASTSNAAASNGGTGQAPKVVMCTADSDEVFGFINYDVRNVGWVAGQAAEVSLGGNVMYLFATAAITQGAQVQLDLENGGVAPKGSAGADYVGWAYDGAAARGALIRVYLKTPSFTKFS